MFSKRFLSRHTGKIRKHLNELRRGVNLLFRHGIPPVHGYSSLFNFPPNNKISIIGTEKKNLLTLRAPDFPSVLTVSRKFVASRVTLQHS